MCSVQSRLLRSPRGFAQHSNDHFYKPGTVGSAVVEGERGRRGEVRITYVLHVNTMVHMTYVGKSLYTENHSERFLYNEFPLYLYIRVHVHVHVHTYMFMYMYIHVHVHGLRSTHYLFKLTEDLSLGSRGASASMRREMMSAYPESAAQSSGVHSRLFLEYRRQKRQYMWSSEVRTNWFRSSEVRINWFRSSEVRTNWFRSSEVRTNWFRSSEVRTNWFRSS